MCSEIANLRVLMNTCANYSKSPSNMNTMAGTDLKEEDAFIKYLHSGKNPLYAPAVAYTGLRGITPRDIAKYKNFIRTHLSEKKEEKKFS